MAILQITNPTDNAKFESQTSVTFQGTAPIDVVTVQLKADNEYFLGSNQVDPNGFWSITYSGFTNTGDRKITAIGFDQANQNEGETSIHIDILDYTTTIYDGLVLDAYKTLEHAIKTPVDEKLTDSEGRKLFEEAIVPILQSRATFMKATSEGQKELDQREDYLGIRKAPCAYSVSCVMKYIAKKLGLKEVQQLFEETFETDCVQVTGVEKKLRRLGFLYFLKRDYLAPRGAIGALAGRHEYQKTLHGSGHIYFITKDGSKRTEFPNPDPGNLEDLRQGCPEKGTSEPKWQIKDLHAENLHFFDHVYMQWTNGYTEGFWLPPGIYPLKR